MTFTVYDYAEKYGITRISASQWLNDRTRLGMFKKTKKKVKINGQSYWRVFYTLVKSSHELTRRGRSRRRSHGSRPVLPVG